MTMSREATPLERLIDALQQALLLAQSLEHTTKAQTADAERLTVALTLAGTYAHQLRKGVHARTSGDDIR